METKKVVSKNVKSFVQRNIKELETKRKKERKAYFTLSWILVVINLATVGVAVSAIILLFQHTEKNSVGVVPLTLAALSAVVVIVIFVLSNISVIYRGINKDKYYKKAVDKIQHEYMQFNFKKEDYSGKDSEEILKKRVKVIYDKYTSQKRRHDVNLFFRAMLGGRDA